MLSDTVLTALITTAGTCITTIAVALSRRATKKDIKDVHKSVDEGRREAILRRVPEAPDYNNELLPPTRDDHRNTKR